MAEEEDEWGGFELDDIPDEIEVGSGAAAAGAQGAFDAAAGGEEGIHIVASEQAYDGPMPDLQEQVAQAHVAPPTPATLEAQARAELGLDPATPLELDVVVMVDRKSVV
jgi:hypothetical protein